MTHLTRWSLANRLIVGLATIAIVVFGLISTFSLKQELLPSTTVPTAIVTATYQGATPQIVADDVSGPIERAVSGVSGVTDVSSTSSNGQAVITVQWEYGLDDDKVVSNIRNAVDSVAPTLPSSVTTDVVTGSTDDIPVLLLAVSTDLPLDQSGRLVQDIAVPELSAIDGVRQVSVTGEDTTQVTITLRPHDLTKHDLAAATVSQSVQSQLTVVPAGSAYDKNLQLAVQVGDSTDSVQQVKDLAIATSDGPIKLSQIADVKIESISSTSIARADGRPALSVSVLKETDGDSVAISHAVTDLLPSLEKTIGNNAKFNTVFDQAPLIEQSIHDLAVEGGLGLLFAVVVILLFLWSLRSTLITAISIPLSLLIALIGLNVGGYSLNIFTLAALTVAVGRVVDDSIVVLENIKRHNTGHADLTAADIVESVKEVAGAVTASTATTIAVFLPVAIVSGVTGELFRPFAITVAVALTASLLVSMTVVPVLAYWFLRRRRRKTPAGVAGLPPATAPAGPGLAGSTSGGPVVTGATVGAGAALAGSPAVAGAAVGPASLADKPDFEHPSQHISDETKVTRLQKGYLPVLGWGLRHPVITLAIALVVFVGTLGASTLLKTDFLGSISDQSTLTIQQELPAGTRLSAMSDAAAKVEGVLADDPQVKSYLTTIAGSIYGVGGGGSGNTAEITVQLVEGATADAVKPDLESRLSELGDSAGKVTVTQAANGSTNNNVTVTVKGDNIDDVRKGSEAVQAQLATVPGLTDITSNLAEQRKLLEVQVDQKKAAAQGFTQAEVGQAVANAITGTKIGDVTISGEQREVWLRTQEATDPSPADIGNLLLPVSQLQSTNAQQKASDKLQKRSDQLSDQQQAMSDEQQAKADQATADQMKELKKQRAKLIDSRADTQKQLRQTRNKLGPAQAQLKKANANLQKAQKALAAAVQIPVGPTNPPASVALIKAQQELAAAVQGVSGATAGVAQIQAGIKQLEAGIDQVNESLDQVNKQISSANDSAAETAEQRAKSQKLTDAQKKLAKDQKNLSDVRASAIRVKDVATVKQVLAPSTVTQIKGEPSVTITATPSGSDLGATTAAINTKLANLTDLPAGVSAEIGGAATDQQQAFSQLGLAMLVAIALVFMIMVGTFRSLVQPLILMVSIPFAATGAIAGLLITDTPLGVPAMVGLLMLIGIVVTNAIVLIDLINQYRAKGEDLKTAITDGARLRLRPIIMTASATIFALIPMGLGLTGGGAFISQPLAVVVIGGLVSSTILTLLLVPVLYSLVERRNEKKRLRALAASGQPAVG